MKEKRRILLKWRKIPVFINITNGKNNWYNKKKSFKQNTRTFQYIRPPRERDFSKWNAPHLHFNEVATTKENGRICNLDRNSSGFNYAVARKREICKEEGSNYFLTAVSENRDCDSFWLFTGITNARSLHGVN